MSTIAISPQRRDEILDAHRRGTVPASGLDILAVGLERFEATLRAELEAVRAGRGMFKAVRGEYGSGKTFFARWFEELARREGFATSDVQISETETPLHRLETVYRRLAEQLATMDCRAGALRSVIDGWFFTLEEEVMAASDYLLPMRTGYWCAPTRLGNNVSPLSPEALLHLRPASRDTARPWPVATRRSPTV